MTIRKAKMIVNKGGSGSSTFRATLPAVWVREMDLDEDNRDLILTFDGNKIIILKEEEVMENIIAGLSNEDGVKLTGVRLRSEVVADKSEIRYDHLDNGEYTPYEVKIEKTYEIWEVLKTDTTKEKLEINILKEYYKSNMREFVTCDKLIELYIDTLDLSKYGEIVKL